MSLRHVIVRMLEEITTQQSQHFANKLSYIQFYICVSNLAVCYIINGSLINQSHFAERLRSNFVRELASSSRNPCPRAPIGITNEESAPSYLQSTFAIIQRYYHSVFKGLTYMSVYSICGHLYG